MVDLAKLKRRPFYAGDLYRFRARFVAVGFLCPRWEIEARRKGWRRVFGWRNVDTVWPGIEIGPIEKVLKSKLSELRSAPLNVDLIQ